MSISDVLNIFNLFNVAESNLYYEFSKLLTIVLIILVVLFFKAVYNLFTK